MEFAQVRMARPGTAAVLTLVIIFVAVGLASLLVWQNYRAALTAGETKAQSAADVVAAHMEWLFEASDQALRRIDAALGNGAIDTSLDIVEDISQAVGDLPEGFQYSVYDDQGMLRMSNMSAAGSINVADRGYFIETKAGKSIVITPRLIERLSKRPVFVIARRIARGGTFRGVATIAIPIEKMNDFWTSIALGPKSTVSVIRDDGWVLARYPDPQQSLNIGKSPLLDLLKKSDKGTYYIPVSPADGLSRIVGYRRIAHWPLVATSGIEINEALQMFWQTLEMEAAFGLPLLILLVGFSIWIAWLLRAYAARNLELEAAIERNHYLFRELHHRVKNNLQAVSSLIRLQPLPDVVRTDMARRIAAMVAVHEHIYRSDQFDSVELASYTDHLIREIARTYHQQVRLDLRLAPVTVHRDTVLPIGMIVNEVVSNAFKYAFVDDREGVLSVELRTNGDGEAILTIADNGPGMRSDATKGMGSRLINGFVSQIGGRYAFETGDGLTFRLEFSTRLDDGRGQDALDAA